jgi:hypothetical protein
MTRHGRPGTRPETGKKQAKMTVDSTARLCDGCTMPGETRKPILPHPRNAQYGRVREKQMPISVNALPLRECLSVSSSSEETGKKVIMKKRLAVLVRLSAAVGAMILTPGCAILDSKHADGLARLAVWEHESESLAKNQNASKEKYNDAQAQIKGYIEGPLFTDINQKENEWFSHVTISATNAPPNSTDIPPEVTKAVADFKASAGQKAAMDAAAIIAIFEAAYKAVDGIVHEKRKAGGEALKTTLQSYEWKNWDQVSKP